MDEVKIQMPKYRCHKEVWALKIKDVYRTDNGAFPILSFTDDRYAPLQVSGDFCAKHRPQADGYYVVYEDGYQSYSPSNAFESGYTLI
jgi:hypothetical protein